MRRIDRAGTTFHPQEHVSDDCMFPNKTLQTPVNGGWGLAFPGVAERCVPGEEAVPSGGHRQAEARVTELGSFRSRSVYTIG